MMDNAAQLAMRQRDERLRDEIRLAKEFQAERLLACERAVERAKHELDVCERTHAYWATRIPHDLIRDRAQFEADEERHAADERWRLERERFAKWSVESDAFNDKMVLGLMCFGAGFAAAWIFDPLLHWLQR